MIICKIQGDKFQQISLSKFKVLSENLIIAIFFFVNDTNNSKRICYDKFSALKFYEEAYQYESGYMYVIMKKRWEK